MLRLGSFLVVLLIISMMTSATVGPVGAVNAYKFLLEEGTHEFDVDGQIIVVENRRPLEIQIVSAEGGIIQGVIEAANRSEGSMVRITRIGPPDVIIFDGEVTDPVTFDSGSDETGHAEL